MEESSCHEMVIHPSHRFSSMLCLFYFYFLYFVISFKYVFHVDADIASVGKNSRYLLTKLISVN